MFKAFCNINSRRFSSVLFHRKGGYLGWTLNPYPFLSSEPAFTHFGTTLLHLLTAFGHYRQEMGPGTVISPDGLPACGELASGPCRGDGTTLKERLEALTTVGMINVTAVSNINETVGDGAGICDVHGVSILCLCVVLRLTMQVGVSLQHCGRVVEGSSSVQLSMCPLAGGEA